MGMSVVWELNAVSLLTIGTSLVTLTIYQVRSSDRSLAALKMAEEAKACAMLCKEANTILNGSLAAFRESVAQNYITNDDLSQMESRLTKAIDRLGERMDRALESKVTK
jgi:hypothetical protein